MRKNIVLAIMTIAVILLVYFTGYDDCERHYKAYYNATENLLDNVNENYMLDVVMEGDEYQEYLKAKEEL